MKPVSKTVIRILRHEKDPLLGRTHYTFEIIEGAEADIEAYADCDPKEAPYWLKDVEIVGNTLLVFGLPAGYDIDEGDTIDMEEGPIKIGCMRLTLKIEKNGAVSFLRTRHQFKQVLGVDPIELKMQNRHPRAGCSHGNCLCNINIPASAKAVGLTAIGSWHSGSYKWVLTDIQEKEAG